MNPGGGGCSEPRWHHCTPAWATEIPSERQKETQKKEKEKKKKRKEGREGGREGRKGRQGREGRKERKARRGRQGKESQERKKAGAVAHTCNPNTGRPRQVDHLRSRVQDQVGHHDETPAFTKNTKISWAWWLTPVISSTLEAEAGELLESQKAEVAVSRDYAIALQPG